MGFSDRRNSDRPACQKRAGDRNSDRADTWPRGLYGLCCVRGARDKQCYGWFAVHRRKICWSKQRGCGKDPEFAREPKEAGCTHLPTGRLSSHGRGGSGPCSASEVVPLGCFRCKLHEGLGKDGYGRHERAVGPRERRKDPWRRGREEEGPKKQSSSQSWRKTWREKEKRQCKGETEKWWTARPVTEATRAHRGENRTWRWPERRGHRSGVHRRGRGRDGGGRGRERKRDPYGGTVPPPLGPAGCGSSSEAGGDRKAKGNEAQEGEEKAQRSELSVAGKSRASEGEERGRREEKEGWERWQRHCRKKGKGIGGLHLREECKSTGEQQEGEGEKEKEEGSTVFGSGREPQRRPGQGGVKQQRGDASPPAEAVSEKAWCSLEDAGAARSRHAGPECGSGAERERRPHRWPEGCDLFQPDGETLPQRQLQGHEGDAPVSHLHRRTSCRATRKAGGQPGQPIPGHPHGSERRKLAKRPISGAPSIGAAFRCSDGPASGGPETQEDGGQKPRRRMEAKSRKRWRPRMGLWRQQGKRKRQAEGRRQELASRLVRRRKQTDVEEQNLVERQQGEARGCEASSRQGRQEDREMKEDDMRKEEEEKSEEEEYELRFLERICEEGCSLRTLGCLLAWLVIRAKLSGVLRKRMTALMKIFPGGDTGFGTVHLSPKREIFPIRLGTLDSLADTLSKASFSEACEDGFQDIWFLDSWLLLSLFFINNLHGCRDIPKGRWRKSDQAIIENFRSSVQRMLRLDQPVPRTLESVKTELSSRFVSYTGEEVPKMEQLSLSQAVAALPPKEHGGSIPVTNWTKGRTRSFLLHPRDCVRKDEGQKLPKLQAKVHIKEEDRLLLASELVNRNVCGWIRLSEVVTYRNEKVLNGMFGVAKSATLEDGRPHLRVIMNLIPSNSILHQLHGRVQELPGITQYQSLVLEDGEFLQLCQNDMTSAFYLFSLPREWMSLLAFNLVVDGSEIQKEHGVKYCLACCVLPMGWTSAVSVMQEVSEHLLNFQGFPSQGQVTRARPLPSWLTAALVESRESNRSWWRIYLDNFFSGERLRSFEKGGEAGELQIKAEECWNKAGVLSAEKKKVKEAKEVQELGAEMDGVGRLLGASAQRLTRVIQTTLYILAQAYIPTKWLQVVCGRWVHILQFRRPGMCSLYWVWKWIGGKRLKASQRLAARKELMMLVFGACLLHTHLGASVSDIATASDASGSGGAVGAASVLSPEGSDVCTALRRSPKSVIRVPVLVISLFNGIGGAFRAYDLVGVEPMGLVAFDICKAANRVTSRRWPHATIYHDVRSFDVKLAYELLLKFPHIEQIDLWGGFPCTDLSRVKAFRRNLEGTESGLFVELVRVLEILRQVFGRRFPIFHIIENVASMDKKACEEISSTFGETPFRLQPSEAAPISRPRYCWTDLPMPQMEGIQIKDKEYFREISARASFPKTSQWLREGAEWPGESSGDVFPTCMKAIKRRVPPPFPAGLDRCSTDCCQRWEADSYKYPPYQYKDQYVIWSNGRWRLLDSSERDLLHGYGYEHTSLCWSASDIKRDVEGYEDQRCSLVGDSFSLYSFVIFAWASCFKWLPRLSYEHLTKRMGLAPGFCIDVQQTCPLSRKLVYGYANLQEWSVSSLSRELLTRVNHTGSDVRIATGSIMNPKAYPRQSAAASWWQWTSVFKCKWKRSDHINSLEMRSILLALRWRVLHQHEVDFRFVHLTDSYICMSILSKGRSSSEMLGHVLKKISAYCFAFGACPIYIHVESTDNPTDHDSRHWWVGCLPLLASDHAGQGLERDGGFAFAMWALVWRPESATTPLCPPWRKLCPLI